MQSHKDILSLYFLRRVCELEDDVAEYRNRIRYRNHDAVDLLELMLAEERLQAFREFRSDIVNILNLKLDGDKNVF